MSTAVAPTDKLIVTFLLDETGSMESVRDDTIGGFNAYLDSLRDTPGEVAFTLLKFDSNRVEKVCVGKPVAEVARLTRETYRPGAGTPLYDAACKAIKATEKVAAEAAGARVLIVLQTDGQENSSREFKKADLIDMVKEKTAAGWQFVFLGCGMDAYGEAASLGISAASTMSYGRAKSTEAFAVMGATTQTYARGGGFSLSAKQKASAGDVWAGKGQPGGRPTSATQTPVAPVPPVAAWASPAPAPRKPLVDDLDLTA